MSFVDYEFLHDGAASWDKRFQEINDKNNAAILYKTMIFGDEDDILSKEIADQLIAASERGVKVLFQIEVKGNMSSPEAVKCAVDHALSKLSKGEIVQFGEKPLLERMKNFKIQILYANPADKNFRPQSRMSNIEHIKNKEFDIVMRKAWENTTNVNTVDHEKILMTIKNTGEMHAIIGGRNTEEVYRNQWDDFDVFLTGEICNPIFAAYKRAWGIHKSCDTLPADIESLIRPQTGGSTPMRLVHARPAQGDDPFIQNTWIQLFDELPSGASYDFNMP